ncbi:hypothetical protein BJ742DRAFT_766519 [Cladochytrium replicatum]|nr:hypothetical protein BJ742DRAFT_766519 [Cladochytrium replicatum]
MSNQSNNSSSGIKRQLQFCGVTAIAYLAVLASTPSTALASPIPAQIDPAIILVPQTPTVSRRDNQNDLDNDGANVSPNSDAEVATTAGNAWACTIM